MTPTRSSPKTDVVAFDFDGTLIDSKPSIVYGLQKLCHHLQIAVPDERQLRSLIGLTLERVFDQLNISLDQYEAHRVIYSDHMYQSMKKNLRPFPGVIELLDKLTADGHRLGIVTSRGRDSVFRCMEIAGIDAGLFAAVVAKDDVAEHKPSPVPIHKLCDELGVLARDIIYIGDADVDMQAAEAAGCASIFAAYGAEDITLHKKPIGLLGVALSASEILPFIVNGTSAIQEAHET